jgi:hypothetical protein
MSEQQPLFAVPGQSSEIPEEPVDVEDIARRISAAASTKDIRESKEPSEAAHEGEGHVRGPVEIHRIIHVVGPDDEAWQAQQDGLERERGRNTVPTGQLTSRQKNANAAKYKRDHPEID